MTCILPFDAIDTCMTVHGGGIKQAPYCKWPPPKPPSTFQPPEARSLAAMVFGGNWCLHEAVPSVGAGMNIFGDQYV